jgi:hypothetical protein
MNIEILCLSFDFEKSKAALGGYFHISIIVFFFFKYSYAFRDFLVICIFIVLINHFKKY